MKFLNVFSETAGPIFTGFYMGLSVKGKLTICSNGSAPLNKMAAMTIYGRKHIKIFTSTKKAFRLNLGIQHLGLKVCQVC